IPGSIIDPLSGTINRLIISLDLHEIFWCCHCVTPLCLRCNLPRFIATGTKLSFRSKKPSFAKQGITHGITR
ncbi:hypothetical protein NL388_27760, partial [Klebsiella pneumoniae]|nr:hypothetical protein [Klebsiella pneumoniae]